MTHKRLASPNRIWWARRASILWSSSRAYRKKEPHQRPAPSPIPGSSQAPVLQQHAGEAFGRLEPHRKCGSGARASGSESLALFGTHNKVHRLSRTCRSLYVGLLDRFLRLRQRACAAFLARATRASLDIFLPAAFPPMRPKIAAASRTSKGNLVMHHTIPRPNQACLPPPTPASSIDILLTAKHNVA